MLEKYREDYARRTVRLLFLNIPWYRYANKRRQNHVYMSMLVLIVGVIGEAALRCHSHVATCEFFVEMMKPYIYQVYIVGKDAYSTYV